MIESRLLLDHYLTNWVPISGSGEQRSREAGGNLFCLKASDAPLLPLLPLLFDWGAKVSPKVKPVLYLYIYEMHAR
jgi:hypothetical protein